MTERAKSNQLILGGISIIHTAIIGGGASGICAAICTAQNLRQNGISGKIAVLERSSKVGRKLLATGNGRCNLSNENLSLSHFHGDRKIAKSVFSKYGYNEISKFFSSLGLLTKADSMGRVYPYSNRADTVLEALLLACKKYGIEIITDFTALDIKSYRDRLEIISDNQKISVSHVIIACGSRANKGLGSNLGYELLGRMGIPYSPLFPSLTSVAVSENISSLKGVRVRGNVTLLADEKIIHSEDGEIQFTDKAISGICVFNVSRYSGEFFKLGTVNGKPCKNIKIDISLMPEYSFSEITEILQNRRKAFPNIACTDLLAGIFDSKLAKYIAEKSGIKSINDNTIKRLANMLCKISFTPVKSDNNAIAQITAGGITSKVIDINSLALKTDNRIKFCGEILDIDGDCGGYNLSFAWASGMLCGEI